jgi:hypothetical protein
LSGFWGWCGGGRIRRVWLLYFFAAAGRAAIAAGVNHYALVRRNFADDLFFLERLLFSHFAALWLIVIAILKVFAGVALFAAIIAAGFLAIAFGAAGVAAFVATIKRAAWQRSAEVGAMHYPNCFFDFFHFANDFAVFIAAGVAAAFAAATRIAACLHFFASRRIARLAGNRCRGNQCDDCH